jgi:hypothetical protein
MAQNSGRITCPRCGANNFDTVTVCWKCNAPLAAAPSAGTSPAPSAHASAMRLGGGSAAASERAALWLGLLFPYFGLPVGLVFMMLDDDRKQHLGRICILWSCLALVLHIAFMVVASIGMRELLYAMLQGVRGAASRGTGMGPY